MSTLQLDHRPRALTIYILYMRVDLSPRLGGHTRVPSTVERDRRPVEWPINPHYCPPLIHLHSPSPPPERCKVSQQV